jgi:L-threonylcarbamoyladenylate synthase
MKQLDLEDVLENNGLKRGIIDAIKSGSIFIYPTDTVYGIGCNAENRKSVKKIREMKRTDHPFSVIAPSKKWINYKLLVSHPEYLKKLPGPYTFIFKKKRESYLSDTGPGNSLGVRIPRHSFTEIISRSGVPFVTTSANISGQSTIRSVKDITKSMLDHIDFVIDAGTLGGRPSTIIDLTKENPTIIRK